MSNPLGEQDLVGNRVTCADLFNSKTLAAPAALGSGLATVYTPGQVSFVSNVSSNVFQCPYAEGLVLLVSLVSGQASAIALNTGATATSMTAAGTLTNVADTTLHALFVSMPSAAIGSTSPLPGQPTAPFFSVSLASPICEINQISVLAVGKLAPYTDWINVRSGINAVASGTINMQDGASAQPPTNLVGSGAFLIDTNQ